MAADAVLAGLEDPRGDHAKGEHVQADQDRHHGQDVEVGVPAPRRLVGPGPVGQYEDGGTGHDSGLNAPVTM